MRAVGVLNAALLLAAASLVGPAARGGEEGGASPGAGVPEPNTWSPPQYGDAPDEIVPFHNAGEPYHRYFREGLVFTGPGREEPPPAGLESVRIGIMTPLANSPETSIGLATKEGYLLALEEANAAGGYEGLPFEYRWRNEVALWGQASNELVSLAYDDGVWALLGAVDGTNTHVLIRAGLKIEIPMVTTACTDPTLTETNIPWLLRVNPDDRQECYLLAWNALKERGVKRPAVLRSNQRYGRAGVAEFGDTARRMGCPLVADLRWPAGAKDLDGAFAKLRDAKAECVVLWGDADEMGRVVRALRAAGLTMPVFGPDRMVCDAFLREAGPAAEGVTAAYMFDPTREEPRWKAFRERFKARWGHEPDHFAAFAYDGAQVLFEAIRKAGLNRTRIRDALVALRTYDGVTGPMRFDASGNNLGRVILAQVKDGKFVFRAR